MDSKFMPIDAMWPWFGERRPRDDDDGSNLQLLDLRKPFDDDGLNSQLYFKSVCAVQSDITFIRLAYSKTTRELMDMFEFLKLRFRVLNTKVFLDECIRNIFNLPNLDFIYYPHLLSWHFTNCPIVSKDERTSSSSSQKCNCKFGIKYPDYHFLDKDLLDNWCFDGDVLSLTRITNGECGNRATQFTRNVVHDQFLGGKFDADEHSFSVEISQWNIQNLRVSRYHIANRLKYILYLVTLKKYGFSVGFDSDFGMKVVDNYTFHLNQCQWRAKNDGNVACDCNLAFNHPKGWLHLRYNVFEKDESGYAIIKRPVLR